MKHERAIVSTSGYWILPTERDVDLHPIGRAAYWVDHRVTCSCGWQTLNWDDYDTAHMDFDHHVDVEDARARGVLLRCACETESE